MRLSILLQLSRPFEYLSSFERNPEAWPINLAALSCVPIYYTLRSGLTFESVDEILKYHHSYESYLAILFSGTVNNTVQGGSYLFYLWKKP